MRSDRDRLLDMAEAIEAIHRHTRGGKAVFDQDELIRVWCLRHIEILGEAAARISEKTCARRPEVPWKSLVGMRNHLVHGYFDIDWEQVWNVIAKDLPPLEHALQSFLEEH